MGELLGTIPVTRRDVDRLLASADRVKSYSDDSVTRIDLSALRYRRPAETSVKLRSRQQSTRAHARVIAGESIEVRVSPPTAYATAVLGGSLHASAVDGCMRGIVQASGGSAVGIQDGGATVDRITTFTIRRRAPDMALWISGLGGLSCSGRTSMIRIRNVQSTAGSTLAPLAVRSIVRGRYLQGIKRCQERMIAGKRPANGKVKARFTVAPTGSVSKASVKGFDQTLDSCIESLIGKWRFGAPKGPDGKPTSEDFDLDLRLDAL